MTFTYSVGALLLYLNVLIQAGMTLLMRLVILLFFISYLFLGLVLHILWASIVLDQCFNTSCWDIINGVENFPFSK